MAVITADQLFDALDDALARIHEWDGGSVTDKLAAFGLDAEAVRQLLEQRWLAHGKTFEGAEAHLLFVQGFVEGLVTGMQLRTLKEAGYL